MWEPGLSVEVRCHDGCAWQSGYALMGVVRVADEVLLRVRRQGTDRPLPAPLPASHVRPAAAAVLVPEPA